MAKVILHKKSLTQRPHYKHLIRNRFHDVRNIRNQYGPGASMEKLFRRTRQKRNERRHKLRLAVGRFNHMENPTNHVTVSVIYDGQKYNPFYLTRSSQPLSAAANVVSPVSMLKARGDANKIFKASVDDIGRYAANITYKRLLASIGGKKGLQLLANRAAEMAQFHDYSGALRSSFVAAIIQKGINDKGQVTNKFEIADFAFSDPSGIKTPPGTWVQKYTYRNFMGKKIRYNKRKVAYRQGTYSKRKSHVSWTLKDGRKRSRTYERNDFRVYDPDYDRLDGFRDEKFIKISKLKPTYRKNSERSATIILQNTAPYSARVESMKGKRVLGADLNDGLKRVSVEVTNKTIRETHKELRKSGELKKMYVRSTQNTIDALISDINKKNGFRR